MSSSPLVPFFVFPLLCLSHGPSSIVVARGGSFGALLAAHRCAARATSLRGARAHATHNRPTLLAKPHAVVLATPWISLIGAATATFSSPVPVRPPPQPPAPLVQCHHRSPLLLSSGAATAGPGCRCARRGSLLSVTCSYARRAGAMLLWAKWVAPVRSKWRNGVDPHLTSIFLARFNPTLLNSQPNTVKSGLNSVQPIPKPHPNTCKRIQFLKKMKRRIQTFLGDSFIVGSYH